MNQSINAGKRRKNTIRVGSVPVDVLLVLICLVICVVILYPFLNVISISLSSNAMISQGKVSWRPLQFNPEGYRVVFGNATIYVSYLWTLWYAGLYTFLSVLLTAMIAYPMTLRDFVLRKPISIVLLITLFFSGGTVPTYLLVKNLDLINKTWALVLPTCVSAFNIFVYRAFYKGISPELREAATIDGAGEIRILFSVYVPLSKALYSTFALFGLVNMWNSYFHALLYIKDNARQPIQMILRSIMFASGAMTATFNDAIDLVNNGTLNPLNVQYACLIATIAPLVFIYPFIQKYFEQGLQVGAIKG